MSLIPEDPNSVKDDGPFLEATPGTTATITVQPSGSTKGECPSATTVLAAERPDPPKSNSDIPQYYGKEAFATWLRRTRFYLEDVPRAERPRMLLKALAPTHLDKALDAGLHAGLPFENLCQQLANIYGQTGSVGDAIEQLHSRRLETNETPNQLAEELERLASVAFPPWPPRIEKLLSYIFLLRLYPRQTFPGLCCCNRQETYMTPSNAQSAIYT
ncbi:hypothetical protein SprV_0200830500 [Sparganum proliferum]